MSTFLELCQGVARESGTISGVQPTSVAGQTGRLLKVVNWTAQAWRDIQNMHAAWLWMRKEFPATALTVAGTARYTAGAWNITDRAEWLLEDDLLTIYKQSIGVSDEGALGQISWSDYRRMYGRGSQTNNRPIHYTVSPAGELCLGPIPDDVYVVKGEYRQTVQALTANSDTPNLPARFHDIIIWKALMTLDGHDEAALQAIAHAKSMYLAMLSELERDQLPRIVIGAEPLA